MQLKAIISTAVGAPLVVSLLSVGKYFLLFFGLSENCMQFLLIQDLCAHSVTYPE